ncbi:MAG TPA: YebC/PmpR family DNA-binding transcriptional regulator [Candidatus Saccharimonadales bacterium]|nr:YebC/PmpR family DNA-binding transcriptional regulator [Candidatus Saccharimonadales bacterium]
MSGHSHYATTHRQKELKDAAKGQVFSKLARAITIAAKTGGGPNPDFNFKLRIAVDKAKAVSMPKENIDRAIAKSAGGEALDEVTYEGFGPGGISVLAEVATDNRNRTAAEVKNLFEKNGGKMGGPGSVSFNFEPKGMILVKKSDKPDDEMLALIDMGADDVVEEDDALLVYTPVNNFSSSMEKIKAAGFEIISGELTQKPLNFQNVSKEDTERVEKFLENFETHDDIQKVHTNANFA